MQAKCDEVQVIHKGEDSEIVVIVEESEGENADLSGVTEIISLHPKPQKGEFLVKKLTDSTDPITIVSGTSKFKIPLTKDETKLLKVDSRTTLFAAIDFPAPTGRKIIEIQDAYDLREFPVDLDTV